MTGGLREHIPQEYPGYIYPPTGTVLNAKSWQAEAPLRMLMNNLHPDVAENLQELVVYGGICRAVRTWKDFDRIVANLKELDSDETLVAQPGKPIAIVRTHSDAPKVLIANSNFVPCWANWDQFSELDKNWHHGILSDDCGGMDLHRNARNRARHVRDLRRR